MLRKTCSDSWQPLSASADAAGFVLVGTHEFLHLLGGVIYSRQLGLHVLLGNEAGFEVHAEQTAAEVVRAIGAGAVVPGPVAEGNAAPRRFEDDAVVGARSFGGSAGNCSLTANRRIMTDESEASSSSGPIHIWAEVTDHTGSFDDVSARITIEAWGRMILLTDFFD